MQETQRTIAFVVVAGLSLVAAIFAAPAPPKPGQEFSDVGTEFFPDFKDPTLAKSLEVVTFDEATAQMTAFSVESKNGAWRIPSRHNYPADGKDQLSKTAASLIGIRRDALVSRRESQFADFGVIDPDSQDSTKLTARGQKITLKGEKGELLAAYIVGKPVAGQNGYYYIRRTGDGSQQDKSTYKAKLDLKLTTKFVDWIEPDLLKLDAGKLVNVTIDKHTLDTENGRLVGKEVNELTRKSSSDPWQLTNLKADKEEVNQDEVKKITAALDDLKIVGVRPKPAKLSKNLQMDEGISLDQSTQIDLGTKGFIFAQTKSGGIQLISKEGDLIASTDQGVSYVLHFGEIFTGNQEEIEVGGTSSEPKEGEAGTLTKPSDSANSVTKSRYLFVTAQFDPEHLGPAPVAPTKPEPPSEEALSEAAEAAASAGEPTNTTQPQPDLNAEFKQAMARFELETRAYDAAVKAHEDKIEAGEKLVKELNARFADWYYVIAAESFESLRQGRKTLVKDKVAEAKPAAVEGGPIITPAGEPANVAEDTGAPPAEGEPATKGEPAKTSDAPEAIGDE